MKILKLIVILCSGVLLLPLVIVLYVLILLQKSIENIWENK